MILDQFSNPTGSAPSGLESWSLGDQGSLGLGSIGSFSRFNPFATEGQELPQPLDFERLVDEFYRRNAVVYSAIRALSRSASEPVFQACTINEEGVQIPDDPYSDPLAKLIANPNEAQECYEFMEQLIIHLQVTGNAFIHKIRSKQGNVLMMELFRPDTISILPQKSRNGAKIASYFREEGNTKVAVRSEDIIHLRLPDAFDEFWGLSPLFVLAKYGDIDKHSTDFLRAFFLNKGVPSGMLMVKGLVQDNDRQRIKDAWRIQHQGVTGWHGIPVLDQGVEYQELSTGLKDLDLNPVFNQTETRIAMVFGVPPILLGTNSGLERSTFSNFSESRRGFWTETLVPMFTRIVRRLTKTLAQTEFGPRRSIKADVSKVAGLQENKEKLRALALKGFDKGLFTVDEARDILDMGPLENTTIGDSLKLSTASLYVPRDQAIQFADLIGDVVTDIVQAEITETEEGKIVGVGDPNPGVGKPDRSDPIEQKVRKAKQLEDEAKALRKEAKKDATDSTRAADDVIEILAAVAVWDEYTGDCIAHARFACDECQSIAPTLDSLDVIKLAVEGCQDALALLLHMFPSEFEERITSLVDRIVGGSITHDNGIAVLELSIGEELPVIHAFFELAARLEAADKTSDEVRAALTNAKSLIKKDD